MSFQETHAVSFELPLADPSAASSLFSGGTKDSLALEPIGSSGSPRHQTYNATVDAQSPSVFYLSELGLDYELRNSWLEWGSPTHLFKDDFFPQFLETFTASGEISTADKDSVRHSKRNIFPHINIPTNEPDSDRADYRAPNTVKYPNTSFYKSWTSDCPLKTSPISNNGIVTSKKRKSDEALPMGFSEGRNFETAFDILRSTLGVNAELSDVEVLYKAIDRIKAQIQYNTA